MRARNCIGSYVSSTGFNLARANYLVSDKQKLKAKIWTGSIELPPRYRGRADAADGDAGADAAADDNCD